MGYLVLIGYALMFSVIGLALRIAYIADVKAKKKRRERSIPMEWQESKEY